MSFTCLLLNKCLLNTYYVIDNAWTLWASCFHGTFVLAEETHRHPRGIPSGGEARRTRGKTAQGWADATASQRDKGQGAGSGWEGQGYGLSHGLATAPALRFPGAALHES